MNSLSITLTFKGLATKIFFFSVDCQRSQGSLKTQGIKLRPQMVINIRHCSLYSVFNSPLGFTDTQRGYINCVLPRSDLNS